MASLFRWLGDAANNIGQTIDNVVPGNQSALHRPSAPQPVRRPAPVQPQPFRMPNIQPAAFKLPGLGNYTVGNLGRDVNNMAIKPFVSGTRDAGNVTGAVGQAAIGAIMDRTAQQKALTKQSSLNQFSQTALGKNFNVRPTSNGQLGIDKLNAQNTRQALGIIANDTINLAGVLPVGAGANAGTKIAGVGLKAASKQLAKEALKSGAMNAAAGGASGVAQALTEQDLNARNAFRDIGMGALAGGALGVAAPVVGAGGKLAVKGVKAGNAKLGEGGYIAGNEAVGFGRSSQEGKVRNPDHGLKPYYEVTDKDMSVRSLGVAKLNELKDTGASVPLSTLIKHDKLAKDYPQVYNGTQVVLDTSISTPSHINYDTNTIHINPNHRLNKSPQGLRESIAHEYQHAIDEVEGIPRGTTIPARLSHADQAISDKLSSHANEVQSRIGGRALMLTERMKAQEAAGMPHDVAYKQFLKDTAYHPDHELLGKLQKNLQDVNSRAVKPSSPDDIAVTNYQNNVAERRADHTQRRLNLDQNQIDANPDNSFGITPGQLAPVKHEAGIAAYEGQPRDTVGKFGSGKQEAAKSPLHQEALKYKSADELFDNLPNEPMTETGKPVVIRSYHGTDKDFDKFKITDNGVRYSGDGIYFTPKKSSAGGYGNNIKELALDLKNPYVAYLPETNIDFNLTEVADRVNLAGHDGMVVRSRDTDTNTGKIEDDWINEIVVFDTNAIKSKSDVAEIYNQAHASPSKVAKSPLGDTKPSIAAREDLPRIPKAEAPEPPEKAKTKKDNIVAIGKVLEKSGGIKDPSVIKNAKGDFVREPQTLNPNRLDLDNTQRTKVLEATTKELREKLTDKQVLEIAKSAGINTKARNIDETAQRIAEDLNARRAVVESANKYTNLQASGASKEEVGKAFSEMFKQANIASAQGTDAGRILSARRIIANELDTPMQRVIKLLNKADVDPEKAAKAAVGVNWDDAKSVTKFYRELVPAGKGDWLDLLRYNSMLSSPLTHIVNNSSNVLNTGIVAPIEKTLTGTIDFFRATATGTERQALAGEGAAYAKGYTKSVDKALASMVQALKGDVEMENLDVHDMPLATEGFKGAAYKFLVPPTRALAASDKFFRTLTEGGERASLEYRQGKGIKTANIEDAAKDAGKYRTFMQDTNPGTEGDLLRTIDGFTNILMSARGGQYGQGVAQISKWTIPFVKTPMNIFKQGVEYSPAGFATLKGSSNKQQQLAKAMIGSSVFMGVGTVLASGRLTWAEPTDEKGRQAFKEAGMQPYSIKMGDKWLQFSKMPPAIAFPFAMVASLDDALKKKTVNQTTVDAVLESVSKYGNFLADQSYAKNVGDALAAVKGDAEAFTRFVSNYPQQLFPWRAASTWVARLGDDTERRVNPNKGFIDKQVETFMQSIPGLRTDTTARLDSTGAPLKTNNGTFNNLSPFKVTNEYAGGKVVYDDMMKMRLDNKNKKIIKEDGTTPIVKTTSKDASSTRVENAKKTLAPGVSPTSASTIKDYAKLDASGKTAFNNDPAKVYQLHQAQYDNKKNSGSLNPVEDYKARQSLGRERITSKYPQEVQQFYGLSKAAQNDYFKADRAKATELYDQAKKLDSELTGSKFAATKYKYGLAKKPKAAGKFKLPKTSSALALRSSSAINKLISSSRVKTPKLPHAPKLARVKTPKVPKVRTITASTKLPRIRKSVA